MISIVIRNKNEGKALENVLTILHAEFSDDISEIILVDNDSSDNSVEIGNRFNCKIVPIVNFSYGRAINLGIERANNNLVLVLSAHAVPVGKSFFREAINAVKKDELIAGVRFVSSMKDMERALQTCYEVKDPVNFGLTAACCLINKKIWLQHKFNEDIVACEDKEWSTRVIKNGYKIVNINEAFFYFAKRDLKSFVKRYRNEKEANLMLKGEKSNSKVFIMLSFIKRIVVTNTVLYMNSIKKAVLILRAELEIHKNLNNK